MVSDDICPDIYLECLERVVEGCCASGTEGFVQPAYWGVLRVLVNCAKSMSHYLQLWSIYYLCPKYSAFVTGLGLTFIYILEPEDEESSQDMIACLSTAFSKMARKLPRAKTLDEFFSISDCMDIILREKVTILFLFLVGKAFTKNWV